MGMEMGDESEYLCAATRYAELHHRGAGVMGLEARRDQRYKFFTQKTAGGEVPLFGIPPPLST